MNIGKKTGYFFLQVMVVVVMLGIIYLGASFRQEMVVEKTYNYPNFTASQYNFGAFGGLSVGEQVTPFIVTDLEGSHVSLADYRGRTVVLETGSATCPQYISRVGGMNRLAKNYPDVVFLMLYVREAHPGDLFSAHVSLEQKTTQAKWLVDKEPEKRTILVDDIKGNAHRALGAWPNMIYLIDANGTVRYRGKWNETDATENALSLLLNDQDPGYIEPEFSPVDLSTLKRVIGRAGEGATVDWLLALPGMLVGHIKEELEME